MNTTPLVKVKASAAVEVCAHFYLSKEARQRLRGAMTPLEFIEALVGGKQYLEGIDFLAHALPAREAVWWGCLCLRQACPDAPSASHKAACRAAVQWVLKPTEEHRAAAKAPAEAAGPITPAGALAAAVVETSGSVAQSHPYAPAKAVAMSIKLSSMKGDPVKMPDRQRLFLELGVGVGAGRYFDDAGSED